MTDRETIEIYTSRAADYAQRVSEPERSERLQAFIDALPSGGRALDLGCGPGNAAAEMAEAGIDVDALDAAEGMVRIARDRFGLDAQLGTFADVDTSRAYDGIWANFSLLHAPRAEMPDHLARLFRALSPGGLLHIGLKTGDGEQRDSLGRFYTYYTDPEISGLLETAGYTILERHTGRDPGLDGVEAPWIILWARRP